MAILVNIPNRNIQKLTERLVLALGQQDVFVWPNVPSPEDVDFALVWKHESGTLKNLPSLKGISSFGAGVDAIFADKELPSVPVARIVDEQLSNSMAIYVTTLINSHKLRLSEYSQQQALALWKPRSNRKGNKVGILGLGELGQQTAKMLVSCGFDVTGWSQSIKQLPGVKSVTGLAEFDNLVSTSDYLVCLLPLTPQTKGVLNRSVFTKMKNTAVLINVARGGHVVEDDLISALYDKEIAHAYLDVFDIEPLPEQHPYWRTPNLTITPHISAVTNLDTALEQILVNYKNVKSGKPMINLADRQKGY